MFRFGSLLLAAETLEVHHALRDSLQGSLRNIGESVCVRPRRGGYGVLDIDEDFGVGQLLLDDCELFLWDRSQDAFHQLFRDGHNELQIPPASGDFSDAPLKLLCVFVECADDAEQLSRGVVFTL